MGNELTALVREQARSRLDAAIRAAPSYRPRDGWIKAVREALGMSGAMLSKRLGYTQSLYASLERSEQQGSITLKSLQAAAEAMDCELVYAIVPRRRKGRNGESFDDVLRRQAERVARKIFSEASGHMALENQAVSSRTTERDIARLRDELLLKMPRHLWMPDDAG